MTKVVFDYSELYGALAKKKVTLDELSKKTGISKVTISKHMSQGQRFDCLQAWLIAQALDLESFEPYFFNLSVNKR